MKPRRSFQPTLTACSLEGRVALTAGLSNVHAMVITPPTGPVSPIAPFSPINNLPLGGLRGPLRNGALFL